MRIWKRALNDSRTHHDRRQSRLSFRRCNAIRERHTQKSETERMQSTRMNINAAAEWGEFGASDDKQRDGGDVRHYTGKRRYRRRTLTVERDRLKKQTPRLSHPVVKSASNLPLRRPQLNLANAVTTPSRADCWSWQLRLVLPMQGVLWARHTGWKW
ncbi:hypothetical protein B0H14DRAFT_1347592 [Mycena olivaceomarginata]|nr:hypothetical protein B0H14DRAFT_1347592 [Mycena olivaceomarginata]